MEYCAMTLVLLLLANGVSKGQTSAREGSPLPKKNPRDVETVVKMKYFRPIRLEEEKTNVPELQATIRELNSDTNDLLDSHRSADLAKDDMAEDNTPSTNEDAVYWTPWSEWSGCSLSCGEGISSRSRRCESRYPPSDIDLKCDGQSVEYKLCSIQKCPEGREDQRSKQCSGHDSEQYFGEYYKWEPYTGPEGATCDLQCTPSNTSDYHAFFQSFGPVIDGTRCGRQGVCIAGECMNIGCDGIVGSNRKKDQCGVCNGDNSTCVHRYNAFDHIEDASPDYHELDKIPKGATNIVVKDFNRCYLVLYEMEDDGSRVPVINGDWLLNFPGEYKASGITASYNRADERETIEIEGPTEKTLVLMVLTTSRKQQPSVEFDYWIPKILLANMSGEGIEPFSSRRRVLQVPDEDDYDAMIRDAGFTGVLEPPTEASTTSTTTSTTTTIATTRAVDTSVREPTKSGICFSYKKSGGKKRSFCESDFVIDVRVIRRDIFGKFVRAMVQVIRTYKTNVRLSNREYIWTPISCRNKVRLGGYYTIMGRTRAKSTSAKGASKVSNVRVSNRIPHPYALIGRHFETVRSYRKHTTRMTKLSRRAKCRKTRRSPMKYGRRRLNYRLSKNFAGR